VAVGPKGALVGHRHLASSQRSAACLSRRHDQSRPRQHGVLEQWAEDEAAHGVDHVDWPMNHETMMMLADRRLRATRPAMWLSKWRAPALPIQMHARTGTSGPRRPGALKGAARGSCIALRHALACPSRQHAVRPWRLTACRSRRVPDAPRPSSPRRAGLDQPRLPD
jgi:hypothetical protein